MGKRKPLIVAIKYAVQKFQEVLSEFTLDFMPM